MNLLEHIESLKKIALALSAEKDLNEFFKLVLDEAMKFTKADGGSVYTVSTDGKQLDFQIICTLSKHLKLGKADITKWPSVSLFDDDGKKNLANFVSYVYHTGKTMKIDDVYQQDLFDNSGTRKYDEANDYHSKSMLGIPLKNHEDKVLGVLQLINAQQADTTIISFTQEHITTVSSLASQAAIALTNRRLIEGLENLLEQFIKAIAETIDRKSKYTGGHIERVAEITTILAELIKADKNFYKSVDFSEDELKELHYASWMHDLGKITTPSHIMDKSTRLEAIIDKIEIIKLRYNFIKDILHLHQKNLPADQVVEKTRTDEMLHQLESDWNFVRKINFEENQITTAEISRIETIFQYHYRIEGKEYSLLDQDEKSNLQIPVGTLTPEQSAIMKEHVSVTYEILSRLNFPEKYSKVALYAASHHETLNGKGYPFKFSADEIPLKSRIIAISDIFESLTAQDRPYKSGKNLSLTLKILANKVKRKEIDRHLMDLILDTGFFLEYARKYLSSAQIDDVNINKIKQIYQENGSDL